MVVYVFEPPTTLTTSTDCADANVHCFDLPGDQEFLGVSIRDNTRPPVGPAAEVAAFVRFTGPDGFRAGIVCGEVFDLPGDGAIHVSVHLLPTGTWGCDWCPDGSTDTSACPQALPVRAQPTRGLLFVAWY